jgi:hypothetical protein
MADKKPLVLNSGVRGELQSGDSMSMDDMSEGATTKILTDAERTKLSGIEAGAQVNDVDSVAGKTGDVSLVSSDVGLGNVDNTSDANKPISTATQTALDLKAPLDSPALTGTITMDSGSVATEITGGETGTGVGLRVKNTGGDGTIDIEGVGTSQGILRFSNVTTGTLASIEADNDKNLSFVTNNATRMTIDDGGNVGIGTDSPEGALNVAAGTKVGGASVSAGADDIVIDRTGDCGMTIKSDSSSKLLFADAGNANVGGFSYSHASDFLQTLVNGAEAMRIDSTGNLLVGKTASDTNVVGGQMNADGLVIATRSGAACLIANRKTDDGTVISLQQDNVEEGNISSGPSQIKMGQGSGTCFTIDSSQNLLVGKTSAGLGDVGFEASGGTGPTRMTRLNATPTEINREGNDGILISFYQDAIQEGNITVTGTTVSYNGGHLARWSRLTDDSQPANLLKGTVMSNLDPMIVWHHEAEPATYYEDNEQLNHTEISTVDGDPNVAGVFVAWDNDDDDYNDFHLAMTGDMVIRVASGTTVARGDLLMSAGDGTAKPQGDDIVRSKTIAKVTSTNISETYNDGSYLVPCVLMAC